MYYHVTSTSFSRLRLVVVCAALLAGAVKEGYGQRVYANWYGYTSGNGPVLAFGDVVAPENSVNQFNPDASYSRLTISGVTGIGAYARLQLKFTSEGENLPPGTPIYVRVANLGSGGLLNLLLGGGGIVTASKGATHAASNPINGTTVAITSISNEMIDDKIYLKIIPADCFNAISINITGTALLPNANLWVYHAYYDCPPPISVADNPTICTGENVTLQVYNPIPESSCDYLWYNSATGGTSIGSGSSFTTDELISTTTFYVGYSGVNPEECGRTPVVVTVLPKPGSPRLTIVNEQH